MENFFTPVNKINYEPKTVMDYLANELLRQAEGYYNLSIANINEKSRYEFNKKDFIKKQGEYYKKLFTDSPFLTSFKKEQLDNPESVLLFIQNHVRSEYTILTKYEVVIGEKKEGRPVIDGKSKTYILPRGYCFLEEPVRGDFFLGIAQHIGNYYVMKRLEHFNNTDLVKPLNIEVLELNEIALSYYNKYFKFIKATHKENGVVVYVPESVSSFIEETRLKYPWPNYGEGFLNQYKTGIVCHPEAIRFNIEKNIRHDYHAPVINYRYDNSNKQIPFFDKDKAFEYGEHMALIYCAWELIIRDFPIYQDFFKAFPPQQIDKQKI